SRIFENRGEFVIARDFNTRSTLEIQLKDTDIACKTADAVGAPALLGITARELFKLAVKKYPPKDDSIEVIRLYEEMGGLEDE
ncbi:MAG: NAD-binding protein, partial [Lachnospiraceae bacterium]|nr:NAD-binding protein [Lachnospiraceae bacterium]